MNWVLWLSVGWCVFVAFALHHMLNEHDEN